MTKLLYLITTTIGGAVGWWLGAFVGIFTAFVLSMVGTAAAIYYTRRWCMQYIG